MNLKKLLSAIGLLAIAAPASLSVVACGQAAEDTEATTMIKNINKIDDLQIDIAKTQTNDKVFDILNHDNLGLAAQLAEYEAIAETFKKDSFKLDTANVYTDKEKHDKIDANTKVAMNKTYYFQFTYKNKNNNQLIPVEIISSEQEELIEAQTLKDKIEKFTNEFNVENQKDAEAQITEAINNLKEEGNNLTIKYTFKNFIDPNKELNGSIEVIVSIQNAKEEELASASKTIILNISQNIIQEAENLKTKIEAFNEEIQLNTTNEFLAKAQISSQLGKLNEKQELKIKFDFINFNMPYKHNQGSTDVITTIKNEYGIKITETKSITITLNLWQYIIDQEDANILETKIQDLTDEFIITDKENAEEQITEKIDSLKDVNSKLNVTYTFDHYQKPSKGTPGSITIFVTMEGANGFQLKIISKTFTLKLSQDVIDQEDADALKANIEALTDEFTIVDQKDAEKQITEKIDSLKEEDSTLIVTPTFGEYQEPFKNTAGSYDITVSIKNANGDELAIASNTFTLKLSQDTIDQNDANALQAKIEALTDEFDITNQKDAEKKVKDAIDELKDKETNLTLDINTTNYKAPKQDESGSIKVTISIKNSKGTELVSFSKTFTLSLA